MPDPFLYLGVPIAHVVGRSEPELRQYDDVRPVRLVESEGGRHRNAVAARKRLRSGRNDARMDQAMSRLLADQFAPKRAGGCEHVDHAVQRRPGRFGQGQDQGVHAGR